MNQAYCFLKIPMFGFTESLNISVSAAIILQQVTEKLRSSEVNWHISAAERLALNLKLIKKTIKNYDAIVARFYE